MAYQLRSYRKFLAVAATAAMVATAVVPAASAASFPDVSDRYKEAVDYLEAEEITNGLADGTFGTYSQIKRADAAVWVAKALGFENFGAPDSGLRDVPERATKAVNVLKDLGIINGKTADTFGSHDSLTRAEMAKIIAIAYDLPLDGGAHPFTDVSATFTDYVKAIYNAGITNGKSETAFGANDPTTRGEFAIFIKKAEEFKVVVPDVLVSDVAGVLNDNHTVTITGKAEGVEKVVVKLPNGDKSIVADAAVVNGAFTITTEIPAAGIHEMAVYDEKGNLLYEGVADKVVDAKIEIAEIKR